MDWLNIVSAFGTAGFAGFGTAVLMNGNVELALLSLLMAALFSLPLFRR